MLAPDSTTLEKSPAVKVSTLVDQLSSAVLEKAAMLGGKKEFSDKESSDKEGVLVSGKSKNGLACGSKLVNFLVERGLIRLITDVSSKPLVVSKKDEYIPIKFDASEMGFDLKILPMK